MSVRPLSWACGHGTEMLLILKKIFLTWLFPDIFRYDSPKKCPTILYSVNTGATKQPGEELTRPAKLIYLNFQPLEVVSRYRDPQLQVAENYSYWLNLSTNIHKSWCLNTFCIPNNCDLVDKQNKLKTINQIRGINPWSWNIYFFFINHEDQRVFSTWNHHRCLSQLFPLHLNTCVIGRRPLEIF